MESVKRNGLIVPMETAIVEAATEMNQLETKKQKEQNALPLSKVKLILTDKAKRHKQVHIIVFMQMKGSH